MTLPKSQKYVALKQYPKGMVQASDFEIKTGELSVDLDEGDVLIKNLFVSLDPYMRGRMREAALPGSYINNFQIGECITTYGSGEVVLSKNPNFQEGDYVTGFTALEEYSKVQGGQGLRKVNKADGLPLSYHVGVLGMPGQTAYHGLFKVGQPQEGETIFVSAASGAVGQVVGQLGKIRGCHVVGSAGSDDKVGYLKELGYDDAFNYKTVGDLNKALAQYCPKGIDVDFENVGGPMLEAVLNNINKGARIALCGMISQYNAEGKAEGVHNLMVLIMKQAIIRGFIVSEWAADYDNFIRDMTAWIKEGKIKYKEDVVEGLDRVPEAFPRLFTGDNFGKLVVKVA